ncbi:ExeM/NucH family extracellular endonuclease [Polycladidibacter hongkongensis]|uniref:ExeM/NucH family extracellular endonuclease n=1 Tax=Polycladidibacter hongkongensis TaxID=1647556 RepID=UPI00082D71E5|nr:ExeM/NucH family extracellular endonuclease [Pseudovibrio hongkongensis]
MSFWNPQYRSYKLAYIFGNRTSETVYGSKLNEFIHANDGNDTVYAGGGHDTVYGGFGDDLIHGGWGHDTLHGGFGADRLFGGAGRDILTGGFGADLLDGGKGNDHLNGGFGDDTLLGGNGHDVLLGEFGNDMLDGGNGNDKLNGGFGDDVLKGGEGNDILIGEFGDDTFEGGDGNDTINGGYGYDTARVSHSLTDYTFGKTGPFWNRATTLTRWIDNTKAEQDTLRGVEEIYFTADDYTYYLDGRNNDALARDDAFATGENTALSIKLSDLLINDIDPDGDTLALSHIDTVTSSGIALTLQNGVVTYAPGDLFDHLQAGQSATDTFSYTITDGNGSTSTATVTLTIDGESDAPTLTITGDKAIDENKTGLVAQAIATDVDSTGLTFSISGGADAALFSIDALTGEIFLDTAQDYENPADANTDASYELEITVSDPQGGSCTRPLTIELGNAARTLIAFDMVGSASKNLLSYANNAPKFSSKADGFQKYSMGDNVPYSIVDDSTFSYPRDKAGIIDRSTNTDTFFGITDTENGNNSGPVTAVWNFDIEGFTDLGFSIDAGAMGDFENNDFFELTYAIDGGATKTAFKFVADEQGKHTYTLADGDEFTLSDPLTDAASGKTLSNVLQTLTTDLQGTGSTLTITLTVETDGGSEAVALQNMQVTGEAIDPSTLPTTFAVAADADTVNEGDSGTTQVTFTVTRAGNSTKAATLDFAVSGAVDADDFGGSLPTGTITFAAGETTAKVTLNIVGDTLAEADEALTLTLSNPSSGTITTPAATTTILNDDISYTLISEIQGDGDASTLVGERVDVSAIVTRVDDKGFFLMEETKDQDGNIKTSEGIYVYQRNANVQVGDHVTFNGKVNEFKGETQLGSLRALTILSSGNALPAAAQILLGETDLSNMEAYEGMLVEISAAEDREPLTIIENYNLDRYGQIEISAGNQVQATQIYDAQTQGAEIAAHIADNMNNRISLDDGSNAQNPDGFAYLPANSGDNGNGYLDAGDTFSETGPTVRLGTQITEPVRGIVDFNYGQFNVVVQDQLVFDETTNSGAREQAPQDVGGELKVASFNVLNLFTTLRGQGTSGPNGLNPRGAGTEADLQRQTDKIVDAMLKTGADAFGLQELENNGFDDTSAIKHLIDALNKEAAARGLDASFTFVDPTNGDPEGYLGTDAITTGIIYRDNVLQLEAADYIVFEEGSAASTYAIAERLNAFTSDDVLDLQRNRPSAAATFKHKDTGESFTMAVSHFKSKGDSNLQDLADDVASALASGAVPADLIAQVEADLALLKADPNFDQGNGQGFWNQVRADAASELVEWLKSDYAGAALDEDHLILGDLNAYAMEDPVQNIRDEAGYTDLLRKYLGEDAYSYVFDGQRGSLDHGLASGSMASQVTGATEWHINADEPDLLGYNSHYTDAGFYNEDPFASSDHDPLIIGLDLGLPQEGLIA